MGFAYGGVWVMGYCGPMGYGMQIPANRVGGQLNLWTVIQYDCRRSFCSAFTGSAVDHVSGLSRGVRTQSIRQPVIMWSSVVQLTLP
jgi:hypothetical protein